MPLNSGSSSTHADRLREAGLKATGPRLAILAALERDRSHPSAEQLHSMLSRNHPSLSLSTVYCTLEAFVRAGLIRRVHARDGRLRVDGTQGDHDHAVCRDCGTIFDVQRSWYPLPQTPERLPSGLDVVDVRLEYDVVCGACRDGETGTASTE
jgi:Fur family peroxide stress response transcriptional regulator